MSGDSGNAAEFGPHSTRWLDIDEDFVARLASAASPEDKWRVLTEKSLIKSADANARSKIIQEFLFNVLIFCEANKASFIESSAAVQVSQCVFYECIFANQSATLETAKELFQNQLSLRIKAQPVGTFSPNFINKFAVFFAQDILRHLFAYQLAFSTEQEDWVVPTLLQVQTPMMPPPLMSAHGLAPVVAAEGEAALTGSVPVSPRAS